jgi:alkaline phosphatase D
MKIVFPALLSCLPMLCYAQKANDYFCFQGHTTNNIARIWCTLPVKDTALGLYIQTQGEKAIQIPTPQWHTYKGTAYANFEVGELQSSSSYRLYTQTLSGTARPLLDFSSFPDNRDSLTLLIGACAMKTFGIQRILKTQKKFPIYQTMAKDSADAMLWMGDNLYFLLESKSDQKQIRKHLRTKKVPDLQLFLSSIPQYAMWDDHDFGPNNADGTFPYKHLSFKNFNNFWANPAPTDSAQGLYYRISFPQADIFMLDNRFQAVSMVNFLGAAQLQWLEDGLKQSDKPFKIIVSGIQAGNKQSTHENLYVTGEFDSILQIIRRHEVEGVVFVNGDRHHSEVFRHDEPRLYPIYEYTNSPLTSYYTSPGKKSPEYYNPARIRGISSEYMYGKIKIVPWENSWKCIWEAINEKGEFIWDVHLTLKELRFQDR